MKKFKGLILGLVILCMACVPVIAGERQMVGSVGLGISSSDIFRGIQQNDSWVINTNVNLDILLSDNLTLVLSSNNVIFDSPAATAQNLSSWYEADLGIGFETIVKDMTFGVGYVAYTSPADAFNTVQELQLFASAQFLELNPYALLAIELNGTRGLSGEPAMYVEFGVAPQLTVLESQTMPVTITLPAKLGLGVDGYYGDAGFDFGYVSFGALASAPLVIMPEALGDWTITAGIDFIYVGDAQKLITGDDIEIVGKVMLSTNF